MENIYLAVPAMIHKEAVVDYRKEFFDKGEKRVNGSCGLHHYEKYEDWLAAVEKNRNLPVTETTTTADTLLGIRTSDNRIVGTIQFRHFITPALEDCGGNIGYAIRPSERQKGYAVSMLNRVIEFAASLGIKRVRIDCNPDNTASERTILHCGGIFYRELTCSHGECTEQVRQYYISTDKGESLC